MENARSKCDAMKVESPKLWNDYKRFNKWDPADDGSTHNKRIIKEPTTYMDGKPNTDRGL